MRTRALANGPGNDDWLATALEWVPSACAAIVSLFGLAGTAIWWAVRGWAATERRLQTLERDSVKLQAALEHLNAMDTYPDHVTSQRVADALAIANAIASGIETARDRISRHTKDGKCDH